ncbi:MAG: radical SAM protein [Candidatus Auribacterota bacterium]
MAKDHFVIPVFVPHNGCPFQCIFCNQNQITGQADNPDPAAIDAQISAYLDTIGDRGRQVLVGFYGGSFTGIEQKKQAEYLSVVLPYMNTGKVQGVRISTRPDFIDDDVLDFLRLNGVTQIELGIQSFDDTVLLSAQRGYTSLLAQDASVLIRKRGFLLGHQFMIGLPGDSWDSLKRTVDISLKLRPDMIRIYPAVVVKDTPMERMSAYLPLTLDEAIRRTAYMLDRFLPHHITVLRVGLHPPQDNSSIVRGPYHPSFRHLVNVERWKIRIRSMLKCIGPQSIKEIYVNTAQACCIYEQKECDKAQIYPVEWIDPNNVRLVTSENRKILLSLNMRISN